MTLADIREAIEAQGLTWRGAFCPEDDDCQEFGEIGTLVLAGFVGRGNWPAFRASPESGDDQPDPLDRWSRRIIGGLADALRARAIFPFDGPPWAPFQRWALKAEPLYASPLGMLIHPDWGLWHAWRGALAFDERFALPGRDIRPSPCDSCIEKPCLGACPVSAFSSSGYDLHACLAHIDSPAGADCMELGCRARRACPVGAQHRHDPDEALFHMTAFRNAVRGGLVPARSG